MTSTPYVLPGTTFGGIDMSQTWEDLQLYERIFTDRPQIRQVIELGTGQGGFAMFLHGQCTLRGMDFLTFDVARPPSEIPGWSRLDIFAEAHLVVRQMEHPLLLICDNGNKPLEVEMYSEHLWPGDLLAVHDWGVEIHPDDIPDCLIPAYENWTCSMTKVFARAENEG